MSEMGIAPNPGKVRAVQEFPVPTSVKGLLQFLGMASYLHGFAKIAAPLHPLTCPFVLVPGLPKCVPEIERFAGVSTSVGGHIEGLGAVLEQEMGMLHPVNYASRSCGITELEALGVVWGAKHFRAYLYGHKCIVYTDHSP